jgi:hypothetical protein
MNKVSTIPTEKELESIPGENWIAWLKAEYNHSCGEPYGFYVTTNKEEMDEEHRDNEYVIHFKTYCSKLNQTYCDVTPEQYEKVKAGFYNKQLEDNKSDVLKMLDFMGYKPKYEGENNYLVNENDDAIFINYSPDIDFRPDINWRDLNKVIDHIEARPSTLMTSIEYLDSDRHKYCFKIAMQEGVTSKGLNPGISNKSKIDAAYEGVMNYLNWLEEIEK